MPCKECGGAIKPRAEKLKVVAGTTAALAAFGALTATPVGWLALLAAGAATPHAGKMIQLKCMAMKESQKAGSYFECDRCGRQIGVGEALGF